MFRSAAFLNCVLPFYPMTPVGKASMVRSKMSTNSSAATVRSPVEGHKKQLIGDRIGDDAKLAANQKQEGAG